MEYKRGLLGKLKIVEDVIEIDENRILDAKKRGYISLTIRNDGNFKNKGYYLSNSFDWIIVKDDRGELVLLELKKES